MTSADRDAPQLPLHSWHAFELAGHRPADLIPAGAAEITAPGPVPAIPAEPPAPPRDRPLLRDRWWFLVVFLVALAILASTDSGRIFYDTKLGVDLDAGHFLTRLWSLWNAREWLGSLEDQYIGYAIPMAPFYLAGQLLHVPVWLIERLWLALLLAVGFIGLVRLARVLQIGSETSRLIAGGVFALWPTYTILIGSTSATALPGLVVPWAVLPLVSAVQGRSTPGRAAARSGLAIVAMSGVNAVCTLAVLVLPGLYILTHTRSRQRLRLSLAWAAAVVAATAWWAIPLLLQGRYAFNFLPYIEQAATTTRTMSAAAVLRGTGTWTAYFNLGGTPWLSAGWSVVTSAPVILASAAASAAGLAGLARRDMPERRWLTICAGLTALVALAGYYGPLGGPFHTPVGHLLDGTLAPFRSLYKLEPVLAVTLTLGCAHAIDRYWRLSLPLRQTRLAVRAATAPLVALTLIGLAWPQLGGQVLQAGSFTAVPGYWDKTAAYLAAHAARQTALVVPSDPHGQFTWGQTIDNPLEPLATSPWVERGLVPYGNAGSQVLLETMEQAVETGHDVPGLAGFLARAGIRYVVVRNDIAPGINGYTPPQVVNETMALSGFRRIASFGPKITVALGHPSLAGVTPGLAPAYPAVEIFEAADSALRPASPVAALPVSATTLVNGGPDSLLQLEAQGIVTRQPTVIAGQQLAGQPAFWAVTDGQRRADNSFGSTRDSQSYTYTADGTNPAASPLGAAGGQPRQLLPVAAAGHQTVAVLQGAASVTASSAGSWLSEGPQYDPANAFDGNLSTAWVEGNPYTPAGQWIQITFTRPVSLPTGASIRLLDDSPDRPVADKLLVTTAAGSVSTDTSRTGGSQILHLPPGLTSTLRITILGAAPVTPGGPGAGIREVDIPGVRIASYLQPAEDLTAGPNAAGFGFSFSQQQVLPAALNSGTGVPSGQRLNRTFVLPAAGSLTARLTAVPAAGPGLDSVLVKLARGGKSAFRVSATSSLDELPAFGPASMYEPGSKRPWIAAAGDPHPGLTFRWHGPRTVQRIKLTAAPGVALPAVVTVSAGTKVETVPVSRDGSVRLLPALHTSRLSLTFPAAPSSRQPVTVARVTIPALRDLQPALPQPAAQFRLRCGLGPAVFVNGRSFQTSVSGTVGNLLGLLPVQLSLCTPGGQLSLPAGRQWLRTGTSTFLTVTGASLTSGTGAGSTAAATRHLQIVAWGSDSRTLRIGPGPASYVEVHEDANPGWTASLDGRPLAPVTLDGWQQAFVLPAGPGGTITLSFRPAAVYHAGLVVSALALLALLGCALGGGRLRRRRARARTAAAEPWRPSPSQLTAGLVGEPSLIYRAGNWLPAVPAAAQLTARPGSGLPDSGWPIGAVPPSWQRRAARSARTIGLLLPLTLVLAVAGGATAIAVPVLALLGWWRPRWLPAIAAGAMLAAGLVVCLSASPTVLGSGPFSGPAQLFALVALAAALMPGASGGDEPT